MKALLQTFALLFFCPFIVNAKIHSVISIEDCTWLASHIIIVTEGSDIDGQVTILESWQGNLQPGDTLNIAELANFKSEESRHIECMSMVLHLGKCLDSTPKLVSGSKIILFLRNKPDSNNWSAIGAVWIEQEVAYGLWDGNKSWEGTFASIGSEASIKDTVTKVRFEMATIKKAAKIEDANGRIQALQPFAVPPYSYTGTIASVEIEALNREAGKASLALSPNPIIIPTVNCADDCAGAIFALLLQRELEFWKATAPQLKTDWWNDSKMSWDELKGYRIHFSNTMIVLHALEAGNFREGTEMVKELRAYWLSLPQLRKQPYIVEYCDAFLKNR